jgi:cholesterol transport system auxiliary component
MKNHLLKYFNIFLLLSLPVISGCNALLPKQPQQTTYYSLDLKQNKSTEEFASSSALNLPTITINMPKANAGFDTGHMMYTRSPHKLEHFAKNEWVDTPARMLQSLMVSKIEKTASFKAVLTKYSLVKSDIRLDTEIVQLIQIFNGKPSQVQFTLRATFIDNNTNLIISLREFDEVATAKSDDPIGGVLAANQAVNSALEKLGKFSQDSAIAWQESRNRDH